MSRAICDGYACYPAPDPPSAEVDQATAGVSVEGRTAEPSYRSTTAEIMMRRCIAEGFGTFILVFAGTGAIMIDDLSGGRVTSLGLGVTFGLAVMVAVYATGHLSGGHINPVVTLGFAFSRHFPWKQVPIYWASQALGGVVASLALRGLFGTVADMGATIPSGGAWQSYGLETVLTFMLMFVIMAVATDNRAISMAAAPAIGGTVGLEAIFAGPISGASMNPVRSLGPALVGWTWTSHWVYWAGPATGAVIGAFLYRWLRGDENSTRASVKERQPS